MTALQPHTVSVIIPTRALCNRRALLLRALDTVLTQEGVRVVPLVVINGTGRDQELTHELLMDRRLRVAILDDADLPNAIRTGRQMVDTEWFAELDDDDLLLPGALATRVQALQGRPDLDGVVTNGFRRDAAGDSLYITDISTVERDPLRALLRKNWLLAGSWLCRTDTVGPHFFDGMPRYRECTYIALRLATACRITFLDRPTVIYYSETPRSESKSKEYVIGKAAAIRQFLELDLPPDVRAYYRTLLTKRCHSNAHLYLKEGGLKKAWAWHLQSLCGPGGWRYLPYTRRLLYALQKP